MLFQLRVKNLILLPECIFLLVLLLWSQQGPSFLRLILFWSQAIGVAAGTYHVSVQSSLASKHMSHHCTKAYIPALKKLVSSICSHKVTNSHHVHRAATLYFGSCKMMKHHSLRWLITSFMIKAQFLAVEFGLFSSPCHSTFHGCEGNNSCLLRIILMHTTMLFY